ncbi:hypothetical protein [Pseudomonas sp. CC6-YY-74]|uniref:hypothetical protein n=1 Tax=Pseudomonas sp. CC6-YY-74 TaxID=1930532 RepID=UPI0009A24CB6|nr:hypothetical protein [Pseudomonas sp. CC6-YY-74]
MSRSSTTNAAAQQASNQQEEHTRKQAAEEAALNEPSAQDQIMEALSSSQRREAGLSGDDDRGCGPDSDDLEAEDLISNDGARSPSEHGEVQAADMDLRIVDADEAGTGDVLDEEEMAGQEPLNSARQRTPDGSID